MTKQEAQQTSNEGLSVLFYCLLGIFILVFYFSLKAIFFNLIEDCFDLPPQAFIFDSYQYGDKAAYLIVNTIAFMITYFFTRYYINKQVISLSSPSRVLIVWIGVAIAALSSFFDIGLIFVLFFTGELDAIGLLKTLVTLTLALLVFAFALFELRAKSLTKASLVGVFFVVAVLNVSAVAIALYQAPPWQQKQMRQDISRHAKIQSVKVLIDEYYNLHRKLPEDLNRLISDMAKSEQDITDPFNNKRFDYNILGKETFSICADFIFDAKAARRLLPSWEQNISFKKGKDCIKFLARHFSECEERCIETCRQGQGG